jgi:adenylate cyclase
MMTPNGTALVVDDSSVNRLVLVRRLETLGLDVLQAENGVQALELLGARPGAVDVVLLDVLMPELDGYETLAAMKADEATRHIPVLIVSGVEELDSVVRCIELGASDYLTKPINASILAARINASLAAKRLHDLEQESLERQRALNRTIERQKEELSRFLSPQVAALVSSPDGEQLLAGHRREITVAFCDLRGFTAFAEQADPEELMSLLSQYHRMMGEAITEHGGTLEHFAGDGVMVFFNDPILQEDHVERCVRMAVAMRDRFSELAAPWRQRGFELGFGVGIAVGYATLGRIGFEGRHDYGAIGNVTILASRLSSQAQAGQILLSPRTQTMLEELIDSEPVGELMLKGLTRPVLASNVVGMR